MSLQGHHSKHIFPVGFLQTPCTYVTHFDVSFWGVLWQYLNYKKMLQLLSHEPPVQAVAIKDPFLPI